MIGSVQIFEVSAAYQLLVLAAALDSGALPAVDRRILLTSVNSAQPETAWRFEDDPAFASLLARFDEVRSYNDLIAPLHPKGFRPRVDEVPLFERFFRDELGIGDALVHLVLESIQTPPSRSLLAVFGTSSATVYAEGLMSYGPTRDPLSNTMSNRIDRVLHLDLVPGLAPMLLTEYGIPAERVDDDAFRAVVGELAAVRERPAREPYALLLGQYLAPLGLVSADEEEALYGDLVEAAIASGFPRVVYKPHPSAPASYAQALAARAERSGGTLTVETDNAPAEVLFAIVPPGMVLGCFSTGLVTASRYWDIPAVCAGTRTVLGSLPLFEDSNRIPLVLVDGTVPHVVHAGGAVAVEPPATTDLAAVLLAVGYAMQWQSHVAVRAAAIAVLQDPNGPARSLIPKSRLTLLRLPGGSLPGADAKSFQQYAYLLNRAARVRELGEVAARRIGVVARR